MGCSGSKSVPKSAAESELDVRVATAIKKIASSERTLKTFDQCIMKFSEIRRAFRSIRDVFKRFDENSDGCIDRSEMLKCLQALGSNVSEHDIDTIFKGSDMKHEGVLSFKHFLLCLALASVLDLMPALAVSAASPTSGDDLADRGRQMVRGLKHVVETYIMFDEDGSGTIDRKEVMEMIKEKKSGGGRTSLLSEERWAEMDWDNDGCITFKEFLSAMFEWVGVDEVDD